MSKDWVWVFDDSPSDVSGGLHFTNRLLAYAENTGEIALTVVAGPEADYFFSPVGQPGADDWRVGPWSVSVDITQPNVSVALEVGLARVNAAGLFQAAYANLSGPITCSPGGIKTFAGTTLAQVGAVPGDRLRVIFRWTGAGAIRFGFGDPSTDVVTVPIVMANPRITWNGNTLDFPGPLTGYASRPIADRTIGRSNGVLHATNINASFRRIRMVLDRFDSAAFWDALEGWWAWARQGNVYAFAMDSGDVVDKTMTGSAASGQKDIPFTDTSTIVAGRKYRVRQASGHNEEIVQVDTITTNVKVSCLANLKYSYVTGDIFRSRDYFPKLVSIDTDPPMDEHEGITYSLDHMAEEDRA
jgi:hypothetical protein